MPVPIIERMQGAPLSDIREELIDLAEDGGAEPLRKAWNTYRTCTASELHDHRERLRDQWRHRKRRRTFYRLAAVVGLIEHAVQAGADTPPAWDSWTGRRLDRPVNDKYERRLRAAIELYEPTTGITELADRIANTAAEDTGQNNVYKCLQQRLKDAGGGDTKLNADTLPKLLLAEARRLDIGTARHVQRVEQVEFDRSIIP